MGTTNQTHCYLISGQGRNSIELRSLLERLGAPALSVESTPPPGVAAATDVSALMRNSAFVCALIEEHSTTSNVIFELGLAAGLRKPIFLVIDPRAKVPISLESFPHVRASISELTGVDFHLRAFLRSINFVRPLVPVVREDPPGNAQLRAPDHSRVPSGAEELEFQVAFALQSIGHHVEAEPLYRENGRLLRPDFIVWIKGMPQSLGNPIVVEVKSKPAREDALIAQAYRYLAATRLRTALVIASGRESMLKVAPYSDGYIFLISPDRFFDLVETNRLVDELIRGRNRFAHGGTK